MLRVFLEPRFTNVDEGDGGVRRVIEAMLKHLPTYGVKFVDTPDQAELINSHISPTEQTMRFLKTHPDIPLVISSHGLYWAEYPWPKWALKANAQCMEAIRWADHVTAPSEWVANSIRRNSLRPTTAIGHGVDIEDWEYNPAKESYILWNKTRIDPICDPEPVNRLAVMLPKCKFLSTYGKDGDNLKVTGTLPYAEAKELVQRAGIYLCTSRETFGIGTLEAMATGSPVVGWDWGGQRDIVKHKKTGWLSPPGNYDDLAEGIEYCFKHLEKMGKATRDEIEIAYQWKDVVKQYADIYNRLQSTSSVGTPKVSVIVPAYALEEFLPVALDSVLAQTFKDWECIVVDDNSPDKCGEIAEQYKFKDDRFKVIHHVNNEYLAGALNTGIEASTGQYVIPLDADNVLFPNALAVLTGELDRDRSIHIAYGNVEFLEPSGKKWHSGWPPKFKAEWQVQYREGQDKPANLIPSTAMYRRQVWELTGGYRRRWKTAEDADFWTRATSYGFRAAMVTEADIFTYRNRDESMSRQHKLQDWTMWMPWSRGLALAPAAIPYAEQVPVASFEPVLISVIIPVGPGHEQLVIDAIDSVDAQTFRLWECIVINDTGFKLPNLPNWVKQIETSIRGSHGVAHARNIGIKMAKAKLFLPLDADDTLEPEALARMFEAWQANKGYIYSDWFERWEDGTTKVWATEFYTCQDCQWIGFIGERAREDKCPKCFSQKLTLYADGYTPELLTKKGCMHAVTALYPVDAWKKVGGFDEKLPAWEDWDFQIALANIGVCGTRIPTPLFTYRKDTGMRREENYAQFEIGKQAILEKWGDYFTGEKTLMACSSCKKNSKTNPPAGVMNRPQGAPPLKEENGFVIMEYIGSREGSLNYRAPSGQIYRFADLEGERQKLVRPEDVEHFTRFKDFRVVRKESPVGVG